MWPQTYQNRFECRNFWSPNSQRETWRAAPWNSTECRSRQTVSHKTISPCKTQAERNPKCHFPHLKHPQVQPQLGGRAAPSCLRGQGKIKTWSGVTKEDHSQSLHINSANILFNTPVRVIHVSSVNAKVSSGTNLLPSARTAHNPPGDITSRNTGFSRYKIYPDYVLCSW